jgi:pimeloyl-ACP methyl ester carboxylesterase
MAPISATSIFAVAVLFLQIWIAISQAARTTSRLLNLPSFDWSTLEPSSNIIWHSCYYPPLPQDSHPSQHILSSKSWTISCALLSLPLSYHNHTNPHTISLPLLKISSPPSPSHLGTIFTLFGGAGNSRIQDFITLSSSDFLDLIDPDFEYDFLTFDNRGFGYSSPSAKCFHSVLDSVLAEERMTDLAGVVTSRDEDEKGLLVRLAAAKAKGELCAKQSGGDADIRRHMTTAYAARDMLEILKRLPDDQSSEVFDSSREHVKKIPKLKFLGLSYGTMVGQTFASLYPEHVSRMVLDGTADAEDWVAKWQMQHLIDTDAVWASFYDDCFQAKEACPMWRASDSNATEIENRMTHFLEKLKLSPLYTVSDGNTRLITYRDVKLAMYWTTMAPSFAAPIMATILDGLIRGYTNVTLDFPFESIPTASNLLNMESQDGRAGSNADAGTAINCADAEDIANSSLADFKEYLSALEGQSSIAAFFQGERKIRCLGWKMRPEWRFTGPFTSKIDKGGSTLSTPILFIGNKLDPMTSLHNSRKIVEDFPGSVVLEQDARGHCALGNVVPSACTLKYVKDYLRDGSLPEPGTVCGKDCNLFDGSCFEEGESSKVIIFG